MNSSIEIKKADLAILGSGPGGYVAAIRAAKLGLKTIIIEKEELGGVCLNTGCIPTKTLHHVVQNIDEIKKASQFGLNIADYSIDFKKMIEKKDLVVGSQRKGIQHHFNKNGVELIKGVGKLSSVNSILVQTPEKQNIAVEANNIIIATGSSAKCIEPFNFKDENILDNIKALSLDKLPSSLLIVGGGIIGCEFANIFATLGTKVYIVELLPSILNTQDNEAAKIIQKNLFKKGVNIFLNTKVETVEKSQGGLICKLSNTETIMIEKVLVSVGREPNTRNIGLEEVGVLINKNGYVIDDEYLKTNINSIFAIGDILGTYQFAHAASKEGKVVVENILGKKVKMKFNTIPWAIFTTPEMGAVGMTEQMAKENNINIKVGVFPFTSSGKAYTSGDTEGFVKIIIDANTKKILGGQVVGARAADLIQEIVIAMDNELTIDNLANSVYSHPIFSEAVMEAAEDCIDLATHISR
ncbi:MAG: dihydrolipoyl dehydrogenase [Actinobacteria bacterium]|nr:dihydrolipoyl dehydrogenase [Actinomycetota bacterium]